MVVGHNSGGDAVVIIAQRRSVEEKKKIREKLIFFQILASGSPPQYLEFTPIYKGWNRGILSLLVINFGP